MSGTRMMSFEELNIPGCFLVTAQCSEDARGKFTKSFHAERFREAGLPDHIAEWYQTVSRPGVLRGLHFQLDPVAQGKLVYCLSGRVLDVGVDLRVGSPTYGQHLRAELTADGIGVYLAPGVAHGYLVLGDEDALMVYGATELYSAEHDAGIMWDSAGVDWPTEAPILSEKDTALPRLADYDSPFRFEGAAR